VQLLVNELCEQESYCKGQRPFNYEPEPSVTWLLNHR